MATTTLLGWLKPTNRLLSAMGRIGLSLGAIHVLTVPGRSSGRPRPTPVVPLRVAGRRYVVAGLPEGDWARNVRAARRGVLSKGRRRTAVTLHEISDPQVRRDVMRAFPVEVPHGAQFFVTLGLVEQPTPEALGAVADRVAVFEVRSC